MNILVFAPHNDDEILGCGGTICKHIDNGDAVFVCEITVGANKERAKRIKKEALEADKILGVAKRYHLDFPVVELDITSKADLNKSIKEVVLEVRPEIVYIPHIGDIHSDHKEVAKAAFVVLRSYETPFVKKIYSYETLSESEWENPTIPTHFVPTFWNDITAYIETKKDAMQCYKTQIREYPHPRSIEAITVLAKYRGTTVGMKYAEAFMLLRGLGK